MLIIARAIAGIGAAGIQNGSLTIIARSLSVKRQAATLGTVMAARPCYGTVDWRSTYGLCVLEVIIRQKLDLIGFSILTATLIQLLLALSYGGNQYAWSSPTVVGMFCGSAAMFMMFLAWEYRIGRLTYDERSLFTSKRD
ncbi:unnamed protein product [Penicillium palitans]